MCTVEVLLIADVMRRTSCSNNNNNNVRSRARSVCRKLFTESTDRRDPSQILRQIEEEINLEKTQKWNFDFQTETPLPGRYQWEPVGVVRKGPASSASTSSVIQTDASPAQTTKEVIVAEVSTEPQAGPKVTRSCCVRKSGDRSNPDKQPKITDYMNHRKRHRTDEDVLSPKLKYRRNSSATSSIATRTSTTPPAT